MSWEVRLRRRDGHLARTVIDQSLEQRIEVALDPEIGALGEHDNTLALQHSQQLADGRLRIGEVREDTDAHHRTKRAVGEDEWVEWCVQIEFDDLGVDAAGSGRLDGSGREVTANDLLDPAATELGTDQARSAAGIENLTIAVDSVEQRCHSLGCSSGCVVSPRSEVGVVLGDDPGVIQRSNFVRRRIELGRKSLAHLPQYVISHTRRYVAQPTATTGDPRSQEPGADRSNRTTVSGTMNQTTRNKKEKSGGLAARSKAGVW
jgi:hypothetical protein